MNRIAALILAIITGLCCRAETNPIYPQNLKLNQNILHNLKLSEEKSYTRLIITADDPYIEFENINIPAHRSDILEIKYRAQSTYNAQVYFLTQEEQNYTESKCVNFILPSTAVLGLKTAEWSTFQLPIGQLSSLWRGTVTFVRFDPSQDGNSGQIDFASARIISKPGSTAIKPAPVKSGEYAADVETGIDPTAGIRFIQNSLYRVETRNASLQFSKINKNGEAVPVADVDFEILKGKDSATFSSKDFPKNNLFCRFQDRWKKQILSLFYKSPYGTKPEDAINGQMDVSMEPKTPPCLSISAESTLTITPQEKITAVSVSGTSMNVGDTPQTLTNVQLSYGSIKLILAPGQPVYIGINADSVRKLSISNNAIAIDVPAQCTVSLSYSPDKPASNPEPRIVKPKVVVLKPGVTVVDALLNDEQKASIGCLTTISSDYIDVNIPVALNEARLEIPSGAKVTRVYDAINGEDVSYKIDGKEIALTPGYARSIRIKCDRLLDYRVMFNAPRPLDGGYFGEEFSNYYYLQWMYLWDGWIDKDGKTLMNPWPWDGAITQNPLPVFIGLHYGNHGPQGSYDTFHKLHPDILQTDNFGNPHKGYEGGFGTPPWMCLVHPALWKELSGRLNPMFDFIKARPYYNRVFGFGSTSEPWIVNGTDMSNNGGEETIFCYNPEHIKWFRNYEKQKWNSNLSSFNKTFGTSFKTWDVVEPPHKVAKTAYFNEWQLSKTEAIIASEDFYRGEIFKHTPNLPNYSHSPIVVIYNQYKNSDTPDIMHIRKDTNPKMFREGGSLYSNDPIIQAYVADSIRAYDTDNVCFPESYAESYGLMYSYLLGESGLFKQSFNLMIPGPSWDSGIRVGDAWQVFSEIMHFITLDMGDVAQPQIGLLFDVISGNEPSLRIIHNALFQCNVDRCVVTTRMIEHGYLQAHPLKMLVLPNVTMLSEKAINEIQKATDKGMKIAIYGDFAKSDYYYGSSQTFMRLKEAIQKRADIIKDPNAFASSLIPQVKTDTSTGLIAYKKSKGITLYNKWAGRTVTIDLPGEMRSRRIAIVSDTGQVIQLRQPAGKMKIPIPGMRACSVVRCN